MFCERELDVVFLVFFLRSLGKLETISPQASDSYNFSKAKAADRGDADIFVQLLCKKVMSRAFLRIFRGFYFNSGLMVHCMLADTNKSFTLLCFAG